MLFLYDTDAICEINMASWNVSGYLAV
jgi:hypothetical protein